MKKITNRIKLVIATGGTGTVTFGTAVSSAFLSAAESDPALVDGDVVSYVLADGNDFEIGYGTIGGYVTTMTRDFVRKSKIAGVAGSTKLTLSGNAVLTLTPSAEDLLFDDTHGDDIASASTTDLETATGRLVDVTGTTNITAITLKDGHQRTVRFTASLTVTNSTSLILLGGVDLVVNAGDFATFCGYAAGVVRCVDASSRDIDGGTF